MQVMKKTRLLALGSSFAIIAIFSVLWHSILFADEFLALGVFTRMDNPIFQFGILAWAMESTAFVFVYYQTRWSREGVLGGLKFGWTMAAFTAAASLVGPAAKTQITDLGSWFLLSGGFIALLFTGLGVVLGWFFSERDA